MLPKNEEVETRACALATHRAYCQEQKEEYHPGIWRFPINPEAKPIPHEYAIARRQVMAERKAHRKFMRDMRKAEYLVVLCRRNVYPQYQIVRLPSFGDPRQTTVWQLFVDLGIALEKLTEVYDGMGRYVEGGKQRLADILQNTLKFYVRPSSDFTVILNTEETYHPQGV